MKHTWLGSPNTQEPAAEAARQGARHARGGRGRTGVSAPPEPRVDLISETAVYTEGETRGHQGGMHCRTFSFTPLSTFPDFWPPGKQEPLRTVKNPQPLSGCKTRLLQPGGPGEAAPPVWAPSGWNVLVLTDGEGSRTKGASEHGESAAPTEAARGPAAAWLCPHFCSSWHFINVTSPGGCHRNQHVSLASTGRWAQNRL